MLIHVNLPNVSQVTDNFIDNSAIETVMAIDVAWGHYPQHHKNFKVILYRAAKYIHNADDAFLKFYASSIYRKYKDT